MVEASFVVDPRAVLQDSSAWRTHDAPSTTPPAKSAWGLAGGVVMQLANYGEKVPGGKYPSVERPGALRIYKRGAQFTDGELSIELSATRFANGIGAAFRLNGPRKYYLWLMDQAAGYHALVRKNGDDYQVLAANGLGYHCNRWYKLRVVLDGPRITVYLDGKKDLETVDATFRKGTFAMYTWRCVGAKFRHVKWVAASR